MPSQPSDSRTMHNNIYGGAGGNGGLGQGGGQGGGGGAGQGPTMNHDVTAENFTMVNNLCVGLDLSAGLLGSFLRSIPNLDCSGLSFLEEIIRDSVMNSMASQKAPLSSPKDRNADNGGRKQRPVYSPGLSRRQNSCVYPRDIGRERAVHARKKRRIAADDNLGGKGPFHAVDAPRRRRKISRSESFDHDSGASLRRERIFRNNSFPPNYEDPGAYAHGDISRSHSDLKNYQGAGSGLPPHTIWIILCLISAFIVQLAILQVTILYTRY